MPILRPIPKKHLHKDRRLLKFASCAALMQDRLRSMDVFFWWYQRLAYYQSTSLLANSMPNLSSKVLSLFSHSFFNVEIISNFAFKTYSCFAFSIFFKFALTFQAKEISLSTLIHDSSANTDLQTLNNIGSIGSRLFVLPSCFVALDVSCGFSMRSDRR